MEEKKELLRIEHLTVSFAQYEKRSAKQGELPVIRDLNVTVREGEIVAVVGSSGSGKSLLAHAIMGILPANAAASGSIFYRGSACGEAELKALRGREIALVPQSVNYLDPLMKVGRQIIGETKKRQKPFGRAVKEKDRELFGGAVKEKDRETFGGAAREKRQEEARMRELLARYGLADEVADLYPFELSGGMARRVLLLTALMWQPRLIIADEPTPGMDLALAKQAMQDFRTFADDGNGVLLITHDLELALEVANRIVVFYAGTTVEEAKVTDFADETLLRHPYTRALYEALPGCGFAALPGTQPYVKDLPAGCPFAPRCADRREACDGEIPVACVRGGRVRCILYTENS